MDNDVRFFFCGWKRTYRGELLGCFSVSHECVLSFDRGARLMVADRRGGRCATSQ